MLLKPIETLSHQRQALEERDPRIRAERYRDILTGTLRPFWETVLGMMMPPPSEGQQPDPVRLLGLYEPEGDVEEALMALSRLEREGAWAACCEAAEAASSRLRPGDRGIRLEQVLVTLALANPQTVAHSKGYSGFGGRPGQLIVLVWPNDYNVPRLPAAAAHEFHHNVRLSYEPWSPDTTVGQYLVIEGLAEAFAGELCGEDKTGPWAHALTDEQHESLRPLYRDSLEITGFNEIRRYMFGDMTPPGIAEAPPQPSGPAIPQSAGYSIGYRLVREYMKRTGSSAVQATYVPWRDIVEQSGYFR